MSIGNYGTSLKRCCEDLLSSEIDFDQLNESDSIKKTKSLTCTTCNTVIWYDLMEQPLSDSDNESFRKVKVLWVRTKA